MTNQFIVNEKGSKTAVIIPINEYEDLLHQHHLNLDLTDEYKKVIDTMRDKEQPGDIADVSLAEIKNRFLLK